MVTGLRDPTDHTYLLVMVLLLHGAQSPQFITEVVMQVVVLARPVARPFCDDALCRWTSGSGGGRGSKDLLCIMI